ncbi:MAG: AzlC family ABC transporter permease [Chloroflexi bacterium]|nr:AzlC family ABC transporter permease [Chloroflexota bacterium]
MKFNVGRFFDKISPAIPVMLGYIPVGFAFGVLSVNAGLSNFESVLMSVIVYAGSSQLISIGLFAAGINPISIIATTLIVNLRHLLMSASLSPNMKTWKKVEVAGFCFELTDETFAVHSLRFESGERKPLLAITINFVCQSSWVAGTVAGVLAGNLISDVRPFALDFALPAMFIALLLLQIRGHLYFWVAVIGGAASLMLWGIGLTQWNVIFATVIAATIGALIETRKKANHNRNDQSRTLEIGIKK